MPESPPIHHAESGDHHPVDLEGWCARSATCVADRPTSPVAVYPCLINLGVALAVRPEGTGYPDTRGRPCLSLEQLGNLFWMLIGSCWATDGINCGRCWATLNNRLGWAPCS